MQAWNCFKYCIGQFQNIQERLHKTRVSVMFFFVHCPLQLDCPFDELVSETFYHFEFKFFCFCVHFFFTLNVSVSMCSKTTLFVAWNWVMEMWVEKQLQTEQMYGILNHFVSLYWMKAAILAFECSKMMMKKRPQQTFSMENNTFETLKINADRLFDIRLTLFRHFSASISLHFHSTLLYLWPLYLSHWLNCLIKMEIMHP